MKSRCSKLRVNSEVLSNKDDVLSAWANHFRELSKSRAGSEESLQQLASKLNSQATKSLFNEEYILNVPEELGCAIRKLKSGRASGPDG